MQTLRPMTSQPVGALRAALASAVLFLGCGETTSPTDSDLDMSNLVTSDMNVNAQNNPVAVPRDAVLASAQIAATPDIDGTWNYSETVFLVLRPGNEVLHLSCSSPDGVLTIVQTGSSFTGTLTHPTGTCVTKDGVSVPTPWSLPYHATLSGRINGKALHIDQIDAPPADPVHCPKNGTIRLEDGSAVELTTKGRCDLRGAPFRPAMATNEGTAVR